MTRDISGSQSYLNRPDPSLEKLVGHLRSPKCATLKVAKKRYTCIAQHQDSSAGSTEEETALFGEELPSVYDCICVLKSCRKSKQVAHAKAVHVHLCKNGLEDQTDLGNLLVTVLLESGGRPQALNLFKRLHERNELSWTALIQDLVDSSEFQGALHEYDQMAEDSVAFSRYALVPALQSCSGQKSLEKGREVHAQATKLGFCTTDGHLRSSLVDMYSKCGSMVDAQGLIDNHPEEDAVAYTALMAGYIKQGAGDEALECFDQMQNKDMTLGASTFVCSLKAIILLGAVEKGQQIHAEIMKEGWETNDFIGSSLVDLYAKCGLLSEAQAVFDELPERDVVSWTALIAGYVEHGFGEQALQCLEKMDSDDVPQNVVTLMFGLKACSITGDVGRTQDMHSNIAKAGFESNLLIANTLVDTYAKRGMLVDAWLVFNKLSVRDAATWNSLLSGYSEQGLGEEALKSFHDLRAQGLFPDVVTFVNCLGACKSIESIHEGRQLHMEIVKQGLDSLLCVGSTLLDMYMKCQCIEEGWEVFHTLPARDSVSWTALMEGYAEAELYEEALDCLEQMQQENVPFHSYTYASGLKACKGEGLVINGQELHSGLVKLGFDQDRYISNSLVDLYASLGLFLEAEAVFHKLHIPDEISWIVLMSGYGECGLDDAVLDCLESMQQDGVALNEAVCVMVLKACGNLGAIDKGREIHLSIIQERLERNPFVNSSLVDMYSKCGFLRDAFEVFSELPVQSVVTWTALISGLVEAGFGKKALTYLEQMDLAGLSPSPTTFVCGLKACGSLKDLERGRWLYAEIMKEEYESNIFVGSSLIDMYARCRYMGHAQEIFDEMPVKDVVVWTALLAGFNKNGFAKEALACFEQMKADVPPNGVTFVCALKTCGSLKAVDKGKGIHSEVVTKGLEANQNIRSSLVDMYARCGLLEEAEEVFDELEVRDLMPWTALMVGYAKQSQASKALDVLERMQSEDVLLTVEDWAEVLSACSNASTGEIFLILHNIIVERGYEFNTSIHTTLESLYADCGLSTIGSINKTIPQAAPQHASLEDVLVAV